MGISSSGDAIVVSGIAWTIITIGKVIGTGLGALIGAIISAIKLQKGQIKRTRNNLFLGDASYEWRDRCNAVRRIY